MDSVGLILSDACYTAAFILQRVFFLLRNICIGIDNRRLNSNSPTHNNIVVSNVFLRRLLGLHQGDPLSMLFSSTTLQIGLSKRRNIL